MLIVQKFGGSSVADAERIRRVAGIIADAHALGDGPVVVLSARGDTTDTLLENAGEITHAPHRRELDVLRYIQYFTAPGTAFHLSWGLPFAEAMLTLGALGVHTKLLT